jgi:hypothetical protein
MLNLGRQVRQGKKKTEEVRGKGALTVGEAAHL